MIGLGSDKKLVKTCQSKCIAPLEKKGEKTQNETNQVIGDHTKRDPHKPTLKKPDEI